MQCGERKINFSECVGSSAQQACPGGMYCQTAGLSAPTGNCSAGYYCILTATTLTPTDGVTGDGCPAGYYCPQGSAAPTPCSPGTYSPSPLNTQVTEIAAHYIYHLSMYVKHTGNGHNTMLHLSLYVCRTSE